ncbi:hypothetical protein [Actinomadura sp. KC06]|uniref:hypothetical protein n=1 Tax=Actinomadura sp. KC06 TaxID=2530369 RepID=UPI0014047FD9|nr:hypothetical protein [Actinomadura sp. KC06]
MSRRSTSVVAFVAVSVVAGVPAALAITVYAVLVALTVTAATTAAKRRAPHA